MVHFSAKGALRLAVTVTKSVHLGNQLTLFVISMGTSCFKTELHFLELILGVCNGLNGLNLTVNWLVLADQ